MSIANTNYTINTLSDKRKIIERLFKEGHISLDEVLELAQAPVNVQPLLPPQPYQPYIPYPYNPYNPTNPYGPITYKDPNIIDFFVGDLPSPTSGTNTGTINVKHIKFNSMGGDA